MTNETEEQTGNETKFWGYVGLYTLLLYVGLGLLLLYQEYNSTTSLIYSKDFKPMTKEELREASECYGSCWNYLIK